jgi:hypothetical protein
LSAGLLNSIVAVVTLAGLAWLLYRPKLQESRTYKATVVPLAEIMDVGFIVFSPIIILSFGYDATKRRARSSSGSQAGRSSQTRGSAWWSASG